MLDEIRKFIAFVKHNKVPSFLAALIVAALVAYKVYGGLDAININVPVQVTQMSPAGQQPNSTGTSDSIAKRKLNQANITVTKAQSTPVRFETANYIYFRATSGLNNALNVRIVVDLGSTRAISREILPQNECEFDGAITSSMQIIKCQKVQKDGFIDVLLLTDTPQFVEIVATADNQETKNEYRYHGDYDKSSFGDTITDALKFISVCFLGFISILLGFKIIGKMFPSF